MDGRSGDDAFVRAAHARGIRVLFDVVPNHVHEQHPLAREQRDWFVTGCICGQGTCDWGTNIKTCWFAPYLPDFDLSRADVARAVTDDVTWWMDRWDGDGIRIDAVPMMPRGAVRRIATTVRGRYEHPGNRPYVLGENFTGPGAYDSLRYDLGPFGLDGSFHFPLMWTLRAAIATERAPMSEIDASFRAGEAAWDGSGAVMGLMIGNHDVSRFASESAGNANGDTWMPPPQPVDPLVYAKQRLALAAVLTMPGAPVIYYGDEIGLAGRSDPDCRRVMPAEADLLPSQRETRELVRRIGRARGCAKALRRGDLRTLHADAESLVFVREVDGSAPVVVALTRRPKVPIEISLPTTAPVALVDVVTGQRVDVVSGRLTVPADAFGARVYVAADGGCATP
jgi:glycosidase